MKKIEIALMVIAMIFAGIATVRMFAVSFSKEKERRYEQKTLQEENWSFRHKQHINDVLFGKYADSISDEMLRDFYPQATDLDSLRYRLKDTYESHMEAEKDGLI